jgi:hypothetical protein
MEAIRSSETSVESTTSTRRHTPEDGILHSHRRENLKSYKFSLAFGFMVLTDEALELGMRNLVWK